MLRIGDWRVDPASGQISRNGETARLEARTMRLLLCLAEHAGEVVSIDELLNQAWSGVTVSSDSVYQAVASLRRLLGDDSKQPAYIATVPRLGYRMVAAVGPWEDRQDQSLSTRLNANHSVVLPLTSQTPDSGPPVPAVVAAPISPRRPGPGFIWAAGGVLCLVLGIAAWAFLSHGKGAASNAPAPPDPVPQPTKSIAVLPFLDLTQGMKEEEFADGMTEELIDKLSKIPGLRVPSPTSSFFYKGKQIPVADIAKALGVAYVLDGSVRKSGDMVRIAARLIRPDTGYVVWSETYDRPFTDRLMVQDDIAGEVTKALNASTEFNTR